MMTRRYILPLLLLCFVAPAALAQHGPTDTGVVRRVTAAHTIRPHVDAVVMADATAGAFAVNLPSSPGLSFQQKYLVCKTDSSVNAVTVQDGAGFSRVLRKQDECAAFQTNRDSATGTGAPPGGEKWIAVSATSPHVVSSVLIASTSVGAGAVVVQSYVLTGARLGDVVTVNPPSGIGASGLLVCQATIPSDNQLSITYYNPTGSPVITPATTWGYALLRN